MSDSSDNVKYKWTPDSTSLLVSVWADRQVQKQLEYATKPQLIWESVARYMRKKGYEVTAKQCRSRMKQVLVCYKEAKKTGTRAGVERYYESIDRVLESKRIEKNIINDNGVDTVDSTKVIKSPPKEIKTNVNIRMRQNKFDDPINKNIEVIPGDWHFEHDEYADSSESNETVLARPIHRCFSPMKNAGTSTISDTMPLGRTARRSLIIPSDERCRYENVERFSEIPTKNSVQNVQNQIIQENMMLRTQLHDNIHHQCQQEYRPLNINPPRASLFQPNILYHPNRVSTNMQRIQSQLQHYSIGNNGAVPQEPRKIINPHDNGNNMIYRLQRPYTDGYPPDIEPNLNDGFISLKNNKTHNLNETYDHPMMLDNEIPCQIDTTTITNNATFNDDTLSIEFIQDSPSPSENEGVGVKTNSYDNRTIPNAPVRTKKIQKLEQLMLNAITSQTEVVNKILAAQDVMVSRILDFDKDRQSRLEDRLDQLMNVVQATVAKKDEPEEVQQINFPTCFSPPPRPGAVPPKLDLVPPKPCRVPCTSPGNVELINQNPVQTRPGVIGPTKPGTIWTKLGPVSQSPFVRAQQQISAVTKAAEHWRTQSSAERRIAQTLSSTTNVKSLITETIKFINNEKLIEERIENARRTLMPDKDQTARRKLFEAPQEKKESPGRKEACAAIVLTSAFLDIERQAEEKSRYNSTRYENESISSDDLLTGQGESYDRLRRLSIRKPKTVHGNILGDKLDTSTPAKTTRDNYNNNNNNNYEDEPRQTIQQLADLVMKSARFRNAEPINPGGNQQKLSVHFPQRQDLPTRPAREKDRETQRQSCNKALDWLQDRYSYDVYKQPLGPFNEQIYNGNPIGFTTANLNINDENIVRPTFDRQVGFRQDVLKKYQELNEREIQNIRETKNRGLHGELIDKYAQDVKCRRSGSGGDNEEDEEFLDTTTTLQPYRKTSLTSSGTEHSAKAGTNCVIS